MDAASPPQPDLTRDALPGAGRPPLQPEYTRNPHHGPRRRQAVGTRHAYHSDTAVPGGQDACFRAGRGPQKRQ
ncbi:hypothetical protein GCM10010390_29040 [Streptomyces mordarskii]|uniref:Uncharacterized protein n=1 Tax=Streptomyces mordarskii TaxID=1226758 RepID=A0ABP3MPY5_9ACTN